MTILSTDSETGDSVLQYDFSLGELVDVGAFREICASYADLFQIGFKVFDKFNELLIDVKGSGNDFCSYLFSFPKTKSACIKEVSAIREQEVSEGEWVRHNCFTGLRYMLTPIQHEGSVIGKLVYGPYRPLDSVENLQVFEQENINPEILDRLKKNVRKVDDEVAKKVIQNLLLTIEVMLHVGYKHALTSRMHVEAATSSYAELQAKNKALRDSYERLKELDRLKSNFLATVSHELRTPLTSVIGYSEMLLEGLAGELQDEQREYVSTIMEKGEQLLSLISSILDFSKIESGHLRLNLENTDIATTIQSAVSTILPLARKKEIELKVNLPSDPIQLLVDDDKIRQVLINVLGNAVKFTRNQGNVILKLERVVQNLSGQAQDERLPAALAPISREYVSISVTDNGIGIPNEKIERIFDSFFQVDGSSTREFGGTGLGLAIVRSLIDAHRGKIEVESQEGLGSTFRLMLPVSQED